VPVAPIREAQGAAFAVEIMDLQVPQYLEQSRIASRTGHNELHFSQTNQWGDNLRKNLARTMARNLSLLLDTPDVSSPYGRSTTRPDYRVLVHLEQFEQASDGYARLAARWQVVDGRDGATLVTKQVRLESTDPLAARDYDSVVDSLQGLYGELCGLIAASIVEQSE
jgi:uncharacterized lipoprotein YmbA